MKKITLILILLAINISTSQTILSVGDIAINGFNSRNPDQFSFILLTSIDAGTSINFTDNGWDNTTNDFRYTGTGAFGEGVITWTSTSYLPCGTQVVIDVDPVNASIANAVETDSNFGLNNSGDQILAFQGNTTTPNFLYAINFGSTTGWTNTTITTNTSAVPPGLADGVSAINFGDFDNGSHDCTTETNQALLFADVSNSANWSFTNGSGSHSNLGTCSYSCEPCSNTITWDGANWNNGVGPDSTLNAIINGDYTTSVDGSFTTCSLTVNAGYILNVSDGTYVDVNNDVQVDGTIIVQTTANFKQNDDAATFTVSPTGLARVNKTTPFKDKWYYYTYWSSPVDGETIESVFPDVDGDRRFWFEAANFVDEHSVGTTNGIPDDIDDDGNDWQIAYGANTMIPGMGYAVTEPRSHSALGAQGYYTFEGAFNTGDKTVTISTNAANIAPAQNWNFIGNPYPSAIDFDAFYAANNTVIDGAAYLWSQATPPDAANAGNQNLNFSKNDYAIYAVGSGSITTSPGGSGTTPNQYIPSGQGFFVAGLGAGGTATFTNAMRMADVSSNTQFFKTTSTKEETSTANRLWLNLTSDNGVFNQILIAYVDGATNGMDGLTYDAPRLSISSLPAVLYSSIENESTKFAIQGKHSSSLTTNEVIKLGFSSNINQPTIYTISLANFEGEFLGNNMVILKDNLLNKTHNLSDTDYSFTSETGVFNNRFEIVFNATVLNTETFNTNTNKLSIINLENNYVKFSVSSNETIKSVKILDLVGREIYNFSGNSSSEIFQLNNLKNKIYIAKVELENGQVLNKKAIKN
ncbi:T9SS type A sorting domain-containing protein [Tamlana sp. 62-3]|uniref:T9SS type A sorting domain-containing protein n=1 Tax=Neotamlana sargassicola TaxID=2883125 RepID=A0A9X1I5W5_9FLAO|nr:T9SS type A sorting domain-containing protein [Tamlana sargassicola]MCB4807415.1 T9SS type A sorting domain-containing protein [Tamlana sargassicola]